MINNIWILIGKKLSGEATAEELLELEELLQQGAADQYPLDMLEEIWKAEHQTKTSTKSEDKWSAFESKLDDVDAIAVEESTHAENAEATKPKQGIIRFLKIISLLVAASFAVFFVLLFHTKNTKITTLVWDFSFIFP